MLSPALDYAYDSAPPSGETLEVSPGLIWVRQSLPFALDHINVWLLHDQDHFSIIDTGINSAKSKSIWHQALNKHAANLEADKIIATHLHPDHVGLAGWFCEEYARPLWMTSKEYMLCRILCEDTGRPAPKEAIDFYLSAGVDADIIEHYKKSFGQFGKAVSPLPQSYRRLKQGDNLQIGQHDWNVIVGNGHSPEHACLYCQDTNTLISGDQILPRISSIVAVWPTEPNANPLKDWLDSCQRLKAVLPADVLVLPAHGIPFRGALDRLQSLLDHHQKTLEDLQQFCKEPKRVIDVFEVLFNSKIDQSNLFMAIGETVANFNYLCDGNMMSKTADENGVDWYVSN